MKIIIDILCFLGTNKLVLGICSLFGIISFCLTIFITYRTNKITKILHYNRITETYNKEHLAYLKTFEGHITSIIDDGINTNKILKGILRDIISYKTKFDVILTLREKYELYKFKKLLQKKAERVDFNEICNHLAILTGRLSKKGDKKNA